MNRKEQTKKILKLFLETYEVDGVCGFFIDDEENSEDDRLAVYMIIDENWLKQTQTKPGFVGKRMRDGIQEEIKKWLGIDVYVGSTVRKCE